MFWRIGSAYQKNSSAKNKALFQAIVKSGPPPGLLASDGGVPVGWCQIAPRDGLPTMDRSYMLKRVDDKPVWAISCLFVRKTHRGKGITPALIKAAVTFAAKSGARIVESYPVDTRVAKGQKTASSMYTGAASTFKKLGFKTIAAHVPHRPIMRHEIRSR